MNVIPTLVVSYINPDLDAYACSLAYAELLQHQGYTAFAGICGVPVPEVQFMFKYLQQVPLPDLDPRGFEQAIIVDCSWPGNVDPRVDRTKIVEVVDHREGTDPNDFPNAIWNVELVGSAATLVAEKFYDAGINPSQTVASFLLAGLLSNSLNLQSSLTGDRDRKMAVWLNKFAQLPPDFAETLFAAKSDLKGKKLHRQLHGDITTPVINGFGVTQIEMVGAPDLIQQRKNEILASLDLLKSELSLPGGVIAGLIDVSHCATYFVTQDQAMQDILAKILKVEFKNDVAVFPKVLGRKQYIPDLKTTYHTTQVAQATLTA